MSYDGRGVAGDRVAGPGDLADRVRQDLVPQRQQRVVRRGVRPVARQRHVDHERAAAADDGGGHRVVNGAAAAASARSASTAASTFGPVTSAPVTTTCAGDRGLRERPLDRGHRLDHGRVLRRVHGGLAEPQAEHRSGEREQRDRGDATPDQRPGDHPPGQCSPEPGRPPGVGLPPAEERDPAGVRFRPEPGQQRGQHGQRADDRDAHDGDRAQREAAERAAADEEQAGHGGHHGQAGHQDRAARRAPGDPERLGERPALRPLLTLAPQVEQRVVDADRHPDDHHDLERAAVDRQPVAGRRHHPDGGGQGGEREQHRDAGRDQRAEHGEHQEQRDRDRGHLGLAEVQRAVDRLRDAGVTGLGDAQVRVPGLHSGDRVLEGGHRLVDVRDVAGDLERDQGAVPVLRHARRLDVRRVCRVGGQRRGHLGRRLAHGRIGGEGGAGRRGLDQHVLGRRVELRRRVLLQHPLGLPGLAGAVFRQVP